MRSSSCLISHSFSLFLISQLLLSLVYFTADGKLVSSSVHGGIRVSFKCFLKKNGCSLKSFHSACSLSMYLYCLNYKRFSLSCSLFPYLCFFWSSFRSG